MLILSSEQVNYCQVSLEINGKNEILPAIDYKNRLLIKTESYNKERKDDAIRRFRNAFLDVNPPIFALIIEDSKTIDVWAENQKVTKIEQQIQEKKQLDVDLEILIAEMRNIGGIKIQDRWYRLTLYPRCFVGSEAVTWITTHLNISREEAIEIG